MELGRRVGVESGLQGSPGSRTKQIDAGDRRSCDLLAVPLSPGTRRRHRAPVLTCPLRRRHCRTGRREDNALQQREHELLVIGRGFSPGTVNKGRAVHLDALWLRPGDRRVCRRQCGVAAGKAAGLPGQFEV